MGVLPEPFLKILIIVMIQLIIEKFKDKVIKCAFPIIFQPTL